MEKSIRFRKRAVILLYALGSSCPEIKILFFEHPGEPKNVTVH